MKNKVARIIVTVAFSCATLLCVCACSAGGGSESKSSELRFVTAGEAGTYYAFGGVLAQHATNYAGVPIRVLTSGGSQANIEYLQKKEAELAFCQSDVMTYAYTGTNLFTEPVAESFSVVGATFREQIQIVTLDPEIKSPADLKGKRVSLGAAGSGMYYGALDVLRAYGMTEDDVIVSRQGNAEAVESMGNDKLDAAFLVAPAPTSAVVDLASSKQICLVSIDDEHAEKIIAASPYYIKETIPAGTYTGLDTDVPTVSVAAVILARNEVSSDSIYKLCKDIYDDPASLANLHVKYAEISAEVGASVTTVPYHPGAAKYFAEKGYAVPTK